MSTPSLQSYYSRRWLECVSDRCLPLVSILLLSSCSTGGKPLDTALTGSDVYSCSCACKVAGIALGVSTWEVCLPDGPHSPEEFAQHCADIVCPATEVMWQAIAKQSYSLCVGKCEPAEGEDEWGANPEVASGVSDISTELKCEDECEDIDCEFELIEDSDAEGGYRLGENNFDICTQFASEECDLESDVFCRPPDGDPPTLQGGIVGKMYEQRSLVIVDPSKSNISILFSSSRAQYSSASAVSGRLWFSQSDVCPGSPCRNRVALSLFSGDIELGGYRIAKSTIRGGTKPFLVDFSSSGETEVEGDHFEFTISAEIDGKPFAFKTKHTDPVYVKIDHNSRDVFLETRGHSTISMDFGYGYRMFDLLADLRISGKLVNRPPQASAGDDIIIDCPPTGGLLLDGSGSTDGDGIDDITHFFWYVGPPPPSSHASALGYSSQIRVFPSAGRTIYSLLVMDNQNQASYDTISVFVRDSTPPVVSLMDSSFDDYTEHSVGMEGSFIYQELQIITQDSCPGIVSTRVIDALIDENNMKSSMACFTTTDTIGGVTNLNIGYPRTSAEHVATLFFESFDVSGNRLYWELDITIPRQVAPICTDISSLSQIASVNSGPINIQ